MLALFAVIFFPLAWLLGNALILVLDRKKARREYFWEDRLLAGIFILIGLAEGAHLGALVRGQSVFAFTKLAALLLIVASGISCVITGISLGLSVRSRKAAGSKEAALSATGGKAGSLSRDQWTTREWTTLAAFLILVGIQAVFLLTGTRVYLEYDETLETVTSFLRSGTMFDCNPLTGLPYEQGMPSRLKILCLPSAFAGLCQVCRANPELVVWKVIPILTLGAAYLAYRSLARALFAGNRFGECMFLLLTAILVFVGDYGYGMEGFGLLHAGFQGTTIRLAVMMPWLFGLCLRRKWRLVPLVLLAEACIVWTLYGLGMGILLVATFLAFQGLRHALQKRKEGPQ
ncbi:MAG: hypothetical protein IKO41_04330 [Lachnospiraceae bacterium]|nr:hypothetical protein [Lachnospiraceae bacterium]